MDLRHLTFRFSSSRTSIPRHGCPSTIHRNAAKLFCTRSSLPSFLQEATYFRELQAAVNVVQKACRLCVDVKKSLIPKDGRILEKIDNTPVTVADFGVQALVSLELGKLFPTVPLVAEEDSAFLRSNNLVGAVANVVNDCYTSTDKPFGDTEVLEAIDRGANTAFGFHDKHDRYWVLDPIDGTRGFLKGQNAFYVVGLALVVGGEVVLGVMGCPNWPGKFAQISIADNSEHTDKRGIIIAAHVGHGTWSISLLDFLNGAVNPTSWTKCFVDGYCLVHKAHFCIPESQTWDQIPLSGSISATTDPNSVRDNQVLLLRACCGSLCKYLMVALGRASVFIARAIPQRTIKAWDHVAGMICVHEAGGKVTDWEGNQLNFSADVGERRAIYPTGGVLVSNRNLHTEILDLISSHSSVL